MWLASLYYFFFFLSHTAEKLKIAELNTKIYYLFHPITNLFIGDIFLLHCQLIHQSTLSWLFSRNKLVDACSVKVNHVPYYKAGLMVYRGM